MNATATVREAIIAQLGLLVRKDAELKQEQKKLDQKKFELEKERASLLGALKEVTGRKSGKPSLRKRDVLPVCLALAEANPGILKEELKELAKHKLGHDLGFDLKGFDLRLKECLSADTFVVAPNGTVSVAAVRPEQLFDDPAMLSKLPVERLRVSNEAG